MSFFGEVFDFSCEFDKTRICCSCDKSKFTRYEIRQQLPVDYLFYFLSKKITFSDLYCRGLPFAKRNTKNLDEFLQRLGTSTEKLGMLRAKLYVQIPVRYLVSRPRDAYRKPRRDLRLPKRMYLTIYPKNNICR